MKQFTFEISWEPATAKPKHGHRNSLPVAAWQQRFGRNPFHFCNRRGFRVPDPLTESTGILRRAPLATVTRGALRARFRHPNEFR